MASPVLLVFVFAFGLSGIDSAPSVYRYPLANYTGTAEVVHGGASGYTGLGSVSMFITSSLFQTYSTLYFHGTSWSFAELRIGEEIIVDSDWSFTMFVYSIAPHRGTIFDFQYDGPGLQVGDLWSNKIKLELNESNIIFTMLSPSGADVGSAVLGTIFTAEAWIPLSVVHDESNGDIIIMTRDNEFYLSKDFQSNAVHILLPQPAKVKLGESYDSSNPFEGSIACFALYDSKFSKSSFDTALTDCDPSNWLFVPTPIDLSNLTTSTSTSTSTTTSTTSTSTSTSTSAPTTSQAIAACPEYYGHFIIISVDASPASIPTLSTALRKSKSQCAQFCLANQSCSSFVYQTLTEMCVLFSQIYDTSLVQKVGVRYYGRRDSC